MFGLSSARQRTSPAAVAIPAPYLSVIAGIEPLQDRDGLDLLRQQLPEGRACDISGTDQRSAGEVAKSNYVLSLFCDPDSIDAYADAVLTARAAGAETVLIVAIRPRQLASLGRWLDRRANAGTLSGTRLMLADDVMTVARQLTDRMQPVREDNVIRMPQSTELQDSPVRNFFSFSPELHALVARIRGYALNGINRAYLLGGPGSGKTSLAYYYFLLRQRGRFVSVNLAAENTGDKAAVKSLLCGHVSGAFPGAGARTGAFTHARDGVCFLDESHEVSGAVMEVLMEALDNGQYLPFGASAKQSLDCALLFATNRGWAHLQATVNLDEFTRLGAAVLEVPELHKREEDMIAVTATTLARLGARCTSWIAPVGCSAEAWNRLRECRWHGNVRGLVRVLESAFVDTAISGSDLLAVGEIERGLHRWEPVTHHSHAIYEAS